MIYTFDLDYRWNIIAFSLECLGLSNTEKHLMMVNDHLQDLLILFILRLPDISSLLCIDGCLQEVYKSYVDGWRYSRAEVSPAAMHTIG
jgi:hypothetical protein